MTAKFLTAAYTVALLAVATAPAHALFMKSTTPLGDEQKFYINDKNTDVGSFSGTVGGNNSGPQVSVTTIGNVDTGNGYANIKPAKDNTLTSLLFTPENHLLFSDFFFRGQLTEDGSVTAIVTDGQGNKPQMFIFKDLNANADFGSLGFYSSDGETIASVKLLGSFKEVKQIDFSVSQVPLPASAPLFGSALLGIAGFGYAARRRRTVTAASFL